MQIPNPECCMIIISTNPRMPLQTNPKSNQIKMQIPNPKCCMIIIFTNPSIPPNESQIKSNSIANDLHNPKDDLYNPKEDLYNPKDAQSQG